jgi:hypothetical protein
MILKYELGSFWKEMNVFAFMLISHKLSVRSEENHQ